jgi:hypothetical protein
LSRLPSQESTHELSFFAQLTTHDPCVSSQLFTHDFPLSSSPVLTKQPAVKSSAQKSGTQANFK